MFVGVVEQVRVHLSHDGFTRVPVTSIDSAVQVKCKLKQVALLLQRGRAVLRVCQ